MRSIWRRSRPASFVARRILVTGAAGTIGRPVCAELIRRGHWVRGMDVEVESASSPAQEWITANIGDPARLDIAMTNIEVVVHLAAVLDDRPFDPDMIDVNLRGAYRVFESARHHGVQRMIFASSSNTVFWHTLGRKRPLRTDSSFAPLDVYSVTKIFAECLGWMYGQHQGLPTIVLRFGWLPNEESRQKLADSPGYHDWYLSPGDAGRGVALAVEAPARRIGKFAVVFIASKPRGAGPFDLRPARRLLGYVPQDQYVLTSRTSS